MKKRTFKNISFIFVMGILPLSMIVVTAYFFAIEYYKHGISVSNEITLPEINSPVNKIEAAPSVQASTSKIWFNSKLIVAPIIKNTEVVSKDGKIIIPLQKAIKELKNENSGIQKINLILDSSVSHGTIKRIIETLSTENISNFNLVVSSKSS